MSPVSSKTRSEFVRQVLQEIGAVSAAPPDDWRKQVEEALRKNKLQMHNVTIYQIRNKLLEQAGLASGKRRRKQAKKSDASTNMRRRNAAHKAWAKRNQNQVTLPEVVKLQKFIAEFGGRSRLDRAIAVLEQLQGSSQS